MVAYYCVSLVLVYKKRLTLEHCTIDKPVQHVKARMERKQSGVHCPL